MRLRSNLAALAGLPAFWSKFACLGAGVQGFSLKIAVDPALISDWMYRLDGKIKGGETIRVIIPTLPEEEAAYYRSLLAEE